VHHARTRTPRRACVRSPWGRSGRRTAHNAQSTRVWDADANCNCEHTSGCSGWMPRTVGAAHAVAGSTAGAALHRLTSRTIGNICMETPMTYIHTRETRNERPHNRQSSIKRTPNITRSLARDGRRKNDRRTEPKTPTTETQQSPAARTNNERHQRGINGVNGAESADERHPRQRHRSRGLRLGC
jgi:hypothetical protein